MRTPSPGYVDALHRWQQLLERATSLDEDPFSDPVDLNVIARIATELDASEDRDWA